MRAVDKNLITNAAINLAPTQHGGFDRGITRAIADQGRTIRYPCSHARTH